MFDKIPSIGTDSHPAFTFDPAEERLLRLVREHYPRSVLWSLEPLLKIAALIDIYEGCFPTILLRKESSVLSRSRELVAYCRLNWRPLPKTQCDNAIFNIYRKEREEQCRAFASYTRQLFFNTRRTMQMRELASLSSPQPSLHKKNKKR